MHPHAIHIARLACLVFAGLIAAAGTARADRVVGPESPRVFYAPTAYLQPPKQVYATVGGHASAGGLGRVGGLIALSTGLGELAEVDLQLSDDVGVCEGCSDSDQAADPLLVASALFKIGVAESRLGAWQPALAMGFRTTLRRRGQTEFTDFGAAQLYGVASKRIGPVQVHAGANLWDSEITVAGQRSTLSAGPLKDRIRPFGGLAWTPSSYPRTTLLLDFSFAPVVDDTPDTPVIPGRGPELRWLFCWGARYQALDWASIELGVRHREGDGLDDATVMIRLNMVFPRDRYQGGKAAAKGGSRAGQQR